MTVLAAPARGSDWFSIHVSNGVFGLSFGSSNWWTYGAAWSDPRLEISYEAALSGYGQWIHVPSLGRVWRPYVVAGWRPFTYGRWVATEIGWVWVSYEPWGYFPHHYGAWAYTDVGWVWAPDRVYRPAPVVWINWGGYVGWYPCGPPGWSHAARGFRQGYRQGLSEGYREGYSHGYDHGYDDGWRDAQYATFVDWNHLSSDDVSGHAVSYRSVGRGTPTSGIRMGPSPPTTSEIRSRGARMVPEVGLDRRTVRVDGRELTVVRPEGVAESVARHARPTVERALSPEIVRQVQSAPSSDRRSDSRGDVEQTGGAARQPRAIERPVIATRSQQRPDVSANRTVPDAPGTSSREPSVGARDSTAGSSARRASPAPRRTETRSPQSRQSQTADAKPASARGDASEADDSVPRAKPKPRRE